MNFFLPTIASAADVAGPSVKQLVYRISYNVLNPLITLGFALALAYFTWTIVEYIRDRNNGTIVGEGKSASGERVVWGLFGLFIMVSAFGIMRELKGIVGSNIGTP